MRRAGEGTWKKPTTDHLTAPYLRYTENLQRGLEKSTMLAAKVAAEADDKGCQIGNKVTRRLTLQVTNRVISKVQQAPIPVNGLP
jgi:hypothetical protein